MEPVEFVPGQMGIEINFASAGTVQATILLGDTNWAEALDVRLLPTGGIELPPQPTTIFGKVPSIRAEGRATYLWNGLFPGTYDLEVRVAGVQQPVAYVEGIEVPGGGPSRDPRLGAIDLGVDLRVLQVAVVDAAGELITGRGSAIPTVFVHDETPEARWEGFASAGGAVEVLTPESALDLFVVAGGYRPRILRGVDSDVTVRLEPWPEVTIQIIGGTPLLPGDVLLRGRLFHRDRVPHERRYRTPRSAGSLDYTFFPHDLDFEFSATGQGRIRVAGTGTFAVQFSLQRKGVSTERISGTVPETIEVQEGIERQTFQISIPESALTRALQRLGR